MLEDLINQQWQALAQFIRGSKRLAQLKAGALFAQKPPPQEPELTPQKPSLTPQKPSLTVAVGESRNANALEEYRRRFAPAAGQGFRESPQPALEPLKPPPPVREPLKTPQPAPESLRPPQPARETLKPLQPARQPLKPPQPAREAMKPPVPIEPPAPPRRKKKPGRRKPCRTGWSTGFSHFTGAAQSLLFPALLRGYHRVSQHRNELIAAAAACVLVIGGAYVYRAIMVEDGSGQPSRSSQLAQTTDERPKTPAAAPNPKLYYERLASGGLETVPAPADAPPVSAGPAETANGSVPVSGAEQTGNAPAPPAPAAAEKQADGGPTVVRSERYLADGTRIDPGQPAAAPKAAKGAVSGIGEARRPVLAAADALPALAQAPPVVPQFAEAPAAAPRGAVSGIGEARRPVLAAAEPAPAPAGAAVIPPAGAPAVVPPASPPTVEPAPAPAGGFFAQVRSDQDLKAAEAELATVADKYKAVLGEVPLSTRQADLKDRGIWFRVLAGPVKSHDEAENLCKRLKSAGLQACIVQKLD